MDNIHRGDVTLLHHLKLAKLQFARHRILYLVFPGSGNLQPRTIDEIQSETEKLLHDWGGIEKLASCVAAKVVVNPIQDQESDVHGCGPPDQQVGSQRKGADRERPDASGTQPLAMRNVDCK